MSRNNSRDLRAGRAEVCMDLSGLQGQLRPIPSRGFVHRNKPQNKSFRAFREAFLSLFLVILDERKGASPLQFEWVVAVSAFS